MPNIRLLDASDSIAELTALLHRAYARLGMDREQNDASAMTNANDQLTEPPLFLGSAAAVMVDSLGFQNLWSHPFGQVASRLNRNFRTASSCSSPTAREQASRASVYRPHRDSNSARAAQYG